MRPWLAVFFVLLSALQRATPSQAQPTGSPPTLTAAPATLVPAPAQTATLGLSANARRFALFVGASQGGAGRATLRYAIRDAERMDTLFSELGGVPSRDSRVLRDPTPSGIDAALRAIHADIEAIQREARAQGIAPRPTQLLFYYSGHSDESGLLLGDQRLPYPALRTLLSSVRADVKIAILDSCASGAFALRKGGKAEAPFLGPDSQPLSGHAFLTSSSATEVAQESERVRGSFFTHYLSTGLRGAADADRNGLVTLQEAYRFAFEETLARTEATLYGAQHAAYDIQLAGVGDLVLTELRRSTAQILLGPEIRGRLYLRDTRGHLVAELDRSAAATSGPSATSTVQLSVPADVYRVTVDDGSQVLRGSVDVRGGPVALRTSDLRPVQIEGAQRRGGDADAPAPSRESVLSVLSDPNYRVLPVNLGIVPSLSMNALERRRTVLNYVSLSFFIGLTPRLVGVDIAVAVSRLLEESLGMQASFIATYAGGSLIGMQGSFVAAVARGDLYGAQLSTVSLAFSDLSGLQAGMGVGYVGGDVRGAQLSGLVSITRGRLTGMQTGVVNYAQRLRGVQLGAINVSDQAAGVQLGALNITRGRMQGLQIGLINIADDLDAAIGFLTISKRGGAWLDVWTGDHAAINLSLRLRARYTYTLLSVAVHPFGSSEDNQAWMYGMGFGGSLPLFQRFSLESDLSVYGVQFGFDRLERPNLLCQWRVLFFARFLSRLALFAGPTLSTLNDFANATPTTRPGYGWVTYRSAERVPSLTLWPGFALGLEL